ncbi:MAG TPA: helix-turn-helix transcriptional regulator [Gemmatimonadaceae bacterium]|jgi:transcriptional regulator with XRE-family HTH domain|nr:helix-turn-helix transcriptional regulator [Gemmatimonadaceae bacterium]
MAHIRPTSTTEEVLTELGSRLRRYRLQQNRRLEDVAAAAGISVPTAQRAESGKNATMATVVRLLRALGRLDALDAFLPEPLVSPIALAERGGRAPQRASRRRRRPPKRKGQDD